MPLRFFTKRKNGGRNFAFDCDYRSAPFITTFSHILFTYSSSFPLICQFLRRKFSRSVEYVGGASRQPPANTRESDLLLQTEGLAVGAFDLGGVRFVSTDRDVIEGAVAFAGSVMLALGDRAADRTVVAIAGRIILVSQNIHLLRRRYR